MKLGNCVSSVLVYALPALCGEAGVYVVCEKAGATPAVVLAEKQANGALKVLSGEDGGAASCKAESVVEVVEARNQGNAGNAGAASGRTIRDGSASDASAGGGGKKERVYVVPHVLESSGQLNKAAVAGIPKLSAKDASPDAKTYQSVSNVLKTRHDTAKNSVGNIR